MAKKSVSKLKAPIDARLGSIPSPEGRLGQAKTRNQMLQTYSNLEIKRDWYDKAAFARVEVPESSLYGGLDPRRRNEVADGGMVQEDRTAMANCSPRFIHREYSRAQFYANPYIDDTTKNGPER